MIQGWTAIYLREMMILRRRIFKQLAAWSVSPLLYLVAFGYAVGRNTMVEGHTYLQFLLPGLAAMTSMTQSFAIANDVNIARFYWHIFDEIQASPVSDAAFVLGEVLAGMTRALLSGGVILALGAVFGVFLSYNPMFWLSFLLNSFLFATLAVGMAMLVKSHADQALLNSFIITPMAFLGGTFFPLGNLPSWVQALLKLLPLTHAAKAIRASAFGEIPNLWSLVLLAGLGAMCFLMAVRTVNHARD